MFGLKFGKSIIERSSAKAKSFIADLERKQQESLAREREERAREEREEREFWEEYRAKKAAELVIHIGPRGGKYRIVDGRKRYDVG